MPLWSILYGTVVGASLGLTGGGGAIFAVPLLVYALGVAPRDAVAISLAAVGSTALVGFLSRWKRGLVEPRIGFVFALAGAIGAPLGTWVATIMNEVVLFALFAGLMIVVAVRMWRQARLPRTGATGVLASHPHSTAFCGRNAEGDLVFTPRCAAMLGAMGVTTGILSGLFGVGGGFVIVPALVLFSGMEIHRAVGTSLMVIALVSVAGIASQCWVGRQIPFEITVLFTLGGVGGLFVGQAIGKRLSGPRLQRVFAGAMVLVAAFILVRNFSA